jgi:hypothetical protein
MMQALLDRGPAAPFFALEAGNCNLPKVETIDLRHSCKFNYQHFNFEQQLTNTGILPPLDVTCLSFIVSIEAFGGTR